MKLVIVSVPSCGHFKVLSRLAIYLAQHDDNMKITFIVTAWQNFTLGESDITALNVPNIDLYRVTSTISKDAGALFCTFKRVIETCDTVVDLCQSHDAILYDFLSPEGYIAGKLLKIPALCSIPAIIGPFDPEQPLFKKGMGANLTDIKQLERKYKLNIHNNLQLLSGCLWLPSESINLVLSWPVLIQASDFNLNRGLNNYVFARPLCEDRNISTDEIEKCRTLKLSGKKIIYCSLGTVVPRVAWDTIDGIRPFIKFIYESLIQTFANHTNYEFYISSGRNFSDIIDHSIPTNFHIFDYLPQTQMLQMADIFITHAGGNSVNESIDATVPMICIPFMFDQHLSARNIAQLNAGISFSHAEDEEHAVIFAESGKYFRASLSHPRQLEAAIEQILTDNRYRVAINMIKSQQAYDLYKIPSFIQSNLLENKYASH